MQDKVDTIKKHIEAIMQELEIPVTESNRNTPQRVAKMWCNELFKNRNNMHLQELKSQMTLFTNNYGSEMVIVKDIPFSSTCEHHWLPFSGKVTIGYVPFRHVIGLSKIPRVVKYFSKKPQLQEQLTTEIGDFLWGTIQPRALYVEMEAEHQCVKCRGAESDCSTKTYYKKELSSLEEHFWAEFKERL